MANSKDMLDDLEFESQIAKLGDRDLMEFTARQVFETRKDVRSNSGRIKTLEDRDKKAYGKVSGISGAIGIAIGSAILFLINHFTKSG